MLDRAERLQRQFFIHAAAAWEPPVDVLESEDFEPLIAEDEDGVLYMSIGLVDPEKEEDPNMVDHPVFFCPFCGSKLQTPDEVDAKVKS